MAQNENNPIIKGCVVTKGGSSLAVQAVRVDPQSNKVEITFDIDVVGLEKDHISDYSLVLLKDLCLDRLNSQPDFTGEPLVMDKTRFILKTTITPGLTKTLTVCMFRI